MPTVAECLRKSIELEQVSDSARLDTELLLGEAISRTKTYLYTHPEYLLSDSEAHQFLNFFQRRSEGEPIAHILCRKEFWSIELAVNPSTLIPRPETELLVEQVLIKGRSLNKENVTVLDLGTGTGAIALAIAAEMPSWNIVAIDKMQDAVNLAEKNRTQLQLNNVTVLHSHWFEKISDCVFDIVVSNPPYIDAKDPHLNQGDVRYEPTSALIAEDNGLADLVHICRHAPAYLSIDGCLLVEHGCDQGESVRQLFSENGFIDVVALKDLAGLDRVTMGIAKNTPRQLGDYS